MQFKRTLSLVLTAAIAAPAAAQSPGAGPQGDPSSAEVLARHVADLGTGALRTGALDDPATWAHAATLFAAASRLDPREPRYWKGQAEARRHAGDVDAAVRALVAYRDPQRGNRPGEPVAMIALLDLYAGRIQSADERLKYFKQLLAEPSISDREVRSHVATLAAQLYFERSQFKDAADTVFQAIQLNPLNAAALRLQHDMIAARDGTPLERARNLLAMLRVNPAQVDVAIELADLLADAGLVRPALDWYAFVRDLAPKADAQLTRSFAVRYAAELYLADQHDAADGLAGQLLEADPSDVDALMLRLIARRGRSSPADYAALLQTARAALRGRVVQFARTGPTTQPAEPLAGDLPDLTADVDNLATSGDERQRYATASALADLAWFELYFARQPGDAAPLVELVAKLLPPDSVLLARLRGWQFVAQGRNDEARVKLSAVADRDPLAAMGLARAASADPATRADASGVGRAALAAHPAGLIGAVLWDGLKDFAFQRMVGPQADAVLDEVNAFDRRVLQIVDNPSAFYNVRGEPTQGAFAYNEPIYARVTVANTSDFPLAVGPGGVIRSDLWFDGELAG
ncbi:MAG TPA: hypothetical protein VK324_06490, partial [Tepidisphaeraceae bacterium]|nr:hypothetical protein [Tepidisphaeraceae bacterium]